MKEIENFQSLELILGKLPIIGTLFRKTSNHWNFFLVLFLALSASAEAQSDAERVSNAVHAVRVDLENALGKSVPSLSLVLQTTNEWFFVSSASTPELALTTNMTFRFASNTKNFTATAVLHMQQRGWLNVEDPITNAMPGYAEPYIPTGTNWAIPYKNQITIEQLLRHSAGVYDVDNDTVPNCGGDSYTAYIMSLDPTHQFTVEEMVAQAALYQLSYFAPDEGYHYSNTGFAMLAEIVARIYSQHSGTDKTLTDYLYDHVIGGDAPQAFPEIRFPNLASDTALPEPYMPGTIYGPSNVTEVISNMNMSAQVGEGSGYGTLPAMNRYIRTLMRGEGALSNDSVRLMQTCTSTANANYGFGCDFRADLGFGHDGARVGNLAMMAYNPDTEVSVAAYLPLWDLRDGMNSLITCFYAMYDAAPRALEALGYSATPVLTNGSITNLTLEVGDTNAFYFTAAKDVYYCFMLSNTVADVFSRVAPAVDPEDAEVFTNGFGWYCDSPGTYQVEFTAAGDTSCDLTLLALKIPTPADYSALDWTNAFIAAHEKFSREYAFTEWKSIDWDAMYSNTFPRIAQAQAETNEQAYYAALHAYVGTIPDGHVRLSATNYTVPDAWAVTVAGGGYGLALAELDDGRMIAAALLTNGPAQFAGMQIGAEILSWGGIAVTSALAQINVGDYPLKAMATIMEIDPQATLDHERLEQLRLLVRDPVGTDVSIQFQNPGAGTPQTVTLTATADSYATFPLLNFACRQDLYADPVDYEILTNGLGYVLIRIEESLTDPSDISGIYDAFAEAVGTFVASNVPGVIVDLRGNFGGRDDLAATLSGFFYTSTAFYEGQEWYNEVDGQFTRITLDETGEYPYLDYMSVTPQPVCYRGPVAVLVNPGTISSGEGMTMAIGRLPQARVIGFYGTDGSFGLCGGSITLPGGYTIQYPYGRSLNAEWEIQLDSQNGVGGVPPEIRVPKTEENVLAFAAGTDVELNYATDYLLGLQNYTNTIAQTSALITNLMAQHNIPALSIALVDGTNIVWAEGFGTANREAGTPADADTIYRIASCSKTFASASIMQLQDAGRLTIEDPVTNTVPAFTLLPRYPDQSSITIRELLAHQAQLPGCYFRHADSTVPYDSYYDMMLALMAEDYLIEPRGFLQKYNNNGFTLIEGVVASANTNGLDYAGYAQANLFQPMGMSNTTFLLSESQSNLLAKVYWNGVLMPDEFVNSPGSGGAYSSASDLARYARFLLNHGTYDGVTVLSSNAVAALWSDQSDEVALVNKEGYAKSGLGWDQIADTSFAYGGQMAWKDGDSLSYSAIICVMPEYGLAAVALNSIPGADTAAAPAAKLALKLALNERFGIPLPSTNPPAFPVSPVTTLTEQQLADVVGIYSAEGGYDLVTGTVSSITWISGADGVSPIRHEDLVPHEDGWFSTTNTPEFRLTFTNIGGRIIMRNHVRYEEYLRIIVQAERFTPAPLSAAWSNRVGATWITGDVEPDSYLWLLGSYPTLQLDVDDGVLSVYSSSCQTLQPRNDDLAFPLLSTASQPSALQVRSTNGHEVIRYSGYDFLRVDELPALQVGQSSTGTLAAGASVLYQFTIAAPVWHGIYVAPTNLIVRPQTVDLSTPGTYSLILQNPATSAVPYTLRLYNFTNTIAQVSALITNLMVENDLVGLGFSMVDGDQVVMAEGFGLADRERGITADKDTVFMIGSCSKPFGAVAAMQLVEEGLLDLDVSITNALPGFTIHQRFANNIITPRTILTHHSGLPGDIFNLGFSVRPIPDAQQSLQQLISSEYTLMPTNTCWAYNNCGFVLLNGMFTNLAGQTLDVFARERLLDRMGMTNSSIVSEEGMHKACPYIDGVVQPDEYVNVGFAGAIYSTASDMAKYMRMLLNGGMGEVSRVLPEERLASMFVKQNGDIPLDQFNTILNMGIGFILDPPWMQYMGKVVWHDGATDFYRSMVRVAVDARLGCFISCNTAEAEAINPEIIDAALKWAYEEKTGIAPPAPVEPGTPALADAPPEVIALATNGVFVTGAGYDYFTANETGLVAHINAQSDSPVTAQLVYRDNGWFMPVATNTPQFLFTQSVGRVIYVLKNFAYGVTNLALMGEQSAGLTPVDPAWTGRLGHWWATNLHPDDISWHGDAVIETDIMLDLSMRENMLMAQGGGVMAATNGSIAFAAGLGRNKGSALQVRPDGALCFLGVHYRSANSIPVLSAGAQTNGITVSNETHWLRIDAPTGQPLTIDRETDAELAAYLYTTNGSQLGQANRAHAFHLDASNAQPVMAAIVRNGTNTGSWTLAAHTNALPFYSMVPPTDWPAELTARSNLYPNTDFGYVFVPENRAGSANRLIGNLYTATNILKIAVARMNSSNPAAMPFFFCNGGPGDSGIRCAYQYFLKSLTNHFDVYLIDQRGIGYSQPDVNFGEQEDPAAMQYRLIMLQGADLSAINTLESSRDLDDLAAAFALTNVNLHGVSYGTLLAQTLMRREPNWLRAVILDGVVAANIPFISQRGPIRNDALNALFADVAAHPRASVWYPDFPTTLYTLATNLQNHPVTLQYSGITNEMNGLDYLNAVLNQMTLSDIGSRERIPTITWRASGQESAALAELYTDIHADTNLFIPGVQSAGMQMMVFKHDILPFDSMEAASNACASLPPLLRQINLNFMQEVVDAAALFAPLGQADPSFILPVTSAIPTLVINGTYDTQTGTNWAAEVARHLPNSHLVTVPTVGHGVLFASNGCTEQIIRAFLANPSNTPDTSCLTNMNIDFPPPWPTNTETAVWDETVTNTFTSPNSGLWYRFNAVSGLVYTVRQSPAHLTISVLNDQADLMVAGGDSDLSWQSPTSGENYLWLMAAQTGIVESTVDVPLIIHTMTRTEGQLNLSWQSLTNVTVGVWRTTNLCNQAAALCIRSNIAAQGWMTSVTNVDEALSIMQFYYLKDE